MPCQIAVNFFRPRGPPRAVKVVKFRPPFAPPLVKTVEFFCRLRRALPVRPQRFFQLRAHTLGQPYIRSLRWVGSDCQPTRCHLILEGPGFHLLKVGGVASVPHGRCVEELRGELEVLWELRPAAVVERLVKAVGTGCSAARGGESRR